jgi:imidazolonepropionase-like amidohydrolase
VYGGDVRDGLTILTDRLFDGAAIRHEPLEVQVRAGIIERVAPLGGGSRPAGPVLDARGALLLPGLINTHVHVARGGMFEPQEPIGVRQVVKNLRGALAAGVTTIGDMGCAAELIGALRAHVAASPSSGPSILASGPLITSSRGYPLDWMPPLLRRMGVVLGCGDERAARRAVARVAAAGMDHIKIAVMHRSYGYRPLDALTEPVALAVVAEAHRLGLRVLAHAHGVDDYRVALAAGVDALMHSSFEPLDEGMVARVRDAGVPVCPTLWVFESACLGAELRWDRDPRYVRHVTPPIARSWRRFAEAWAASGEMVPDGIAGGAPKERAREAIRVAAANLRLLRDAGVPIAFGNDAAYGFSLLARPADELGAMQRAGMSAVECLRAATKTAAELLARPDRGAIAPGKRADLIVVDAAAEHDVTAIEQVRAVVVGGRIVDTSGTPGALAAARTTLAFAGGLVQTAAAGAVYLARGDERR